MTRKVKVDLSRSQNASYFEKGNRFFDREVNRVIDRINELKPSFKPSHVELDEPLPAEERALLHQHDAIFLHGARGVGKTSLLLLRNHLQLSR